MSTNESASLLSAPDTTNAIQSPDSSPVDPDNPRWGFFEASIVWITSVLFLLFVPVLALIPYVIYRMIAYGNVEGLGADPKLLLISIIGVLPSHALTFFVVWMVVTRKKRYPFLRSLGWHWPRNFGPWTTIVVSLALLVLGGVVTYFAGGAETDLDRIIKSSYEARIVIAFLAAVTGPFVEELVYRGVLYSALLRATGTVWAVVIVSVLFAGVHVLQYYHNVGVIAVIAILSVSLTLVRALTGSLLPAYVIHLIFNGVQAVYLVTQPFINTKKAPEDTLTGSLVKYLTQLFG